MPNLKQVNGSDAMRRDYDVSKFPMSGFNETHNSHVGGLIMGRLYPAGYAHFMPHTKENIRNEYKLYAEQLVTPVVSDVNVAVRNFFVTYRAIDKGFEDLLTPTELNGMSASLSAPCFSLRDVVLHLIITFMGQGSQYVSTASTAYQSKYGVTYSFSSWTGLSDVLIDTILYQYRQLAKEHYIDDVYDDLRLALIPAVESLNSLQTGSFTDLQLLDAVANVLNIYFDFFCGEGSVLDYLGYPIMNHQNTKEYLVHMANHIGSIASARGSTFPVDISSITLSDDDFVDFGDYEVDGRLVNEYAVRAYYAIWFEYFRHKHLEPRSANLWEYREFGSTPLFSGTTLPKAIACLLPLRCDNWTDDPFNTADVDDICRHVYAPVIYGSSLTNYMAGPAHPAQNSPNGISRTGNLWCETQIGYVDINGVSQTITAPIPDALSSLDQNYSLQNTLNGYLVDLFSLNKAQMIERFLKRNFAFGDEYRDRMRAHYDVTIDDYRINRPVWLSGSFKRVNIEQQIATTGATPGDNVQGMVDMGTRLAYGQADSDKVSDGIEYFASEFGIRISLLSIVPRAQYDITCPQNFMKKTSDFPAPEFAQQQEDIMNSSEMYRNGLYSHTNDNKPFGHVPYAHAYRYRADDVHGQMLSSKFDYTFCRFYKGLTSDGSPKLNYKFIHCRPNIPMFLNNILFDGQFYGTIKHNILSEKLLPQPVEII